MATSSIPPTKNPTTANRINSRSTAIRISHTNRPPTLLTVQELNRYPFKSSERENFIHCSHNPALNVEICDVQRIFLDELTPGLDDITHQLREDFIGELGLTNFNTQHRAILRIQCRFPQLFGVHFA